MTNLEIRVEMAKRNLKQWQVAKMLGVSESVFSRKMREEFTEEEKNTILTTIRKVV